jgi:phosphoserine phosphatase
VTRLALRAARVVGALVVLALGRMAGAQARPLKDIEVDRIVAVVGTHPILFSEVLEAINFARSRGLQVPALSATSWGRSSTRKS